MLLRLWGYAIVAAILFLLLLVHGSAAHGIAPEYIAAIKQNEGFSARAYWDHAQWSIGYGTKARFPGEVIDEQEAERRFTAELSAAARFVDEFDRSLDGGTRAALASLTYNAGPSWASGRLGALIRAGDMEGAKRVFLSYVRASGQVLPGLVRRRQQEASWFGTAPRDAFAILECRMPDGQVRYYRAAQ